MKLPNFLIEPERNVFDSRLAELMGEQPTQDNKQSRSTSKRTRSPLTTRCKTPFGGWSYTRASRAESRAKSRALSTRLAGSTIDEQISQNREDFSTGNIVIDKITEVTNESQNKVTDDVSENVILERAEKGKRVEKLQRKLQRSQDIVERAQLAEQLELARRIFNLSDAFVTEYKLHGAVGTKEWRDEDGVEAAKLGIVTKTEKKKLPDFPALGRPSWKYIGEGFMVPRPSTRYVKAISHYAQNSDSIYSMDADFSLTELANKSMETPWPSRPSTQYLATLNEDENHSQESIDGGIIRCTKTHSGSSSQTNFPRSQSPIVQQDRLSPFGSTTTKSNAFNKRSNIFQRPRSTRSGWIPTNATRIILSKEDENNLQTQESSLKPFEITHIPNIAGRPIVQPNADLENSTKENIGEEMSLSQSSEYRPRTTYDHESGLPVQSKEMMTKAINARYGVTIFGRPHSIYVKHNSNSSTKNLGKETQSQTGSCNHESNTISTIPTRDYSPTMKNWKWGERKCRTSSEIVDALDALCIQGRKGANGDLLHQSIPDRWGGQGNGVFSYHVNNKKIDPWIAQEIAAVQYSSKMELSNFRFSGDAFEADGQVIKGRHDKYSLVAAAAERAMSGGDFRAAGPFSHVGRWSGLLASSGTKKATAWKGRLRDDPNSLDFHSDLRRAHGGALDGFEYGGEEDFRDRLARSCLGSGFDDIYSKRMRGINAHALKFE